MHHNSAGIELDSSNVIYNLYMRSGFQPLYVGDRVLVYSQREPKSIKSPTLDADGFDNGSMASDDESEDEQVIRLFYYGVRLIIVVLTVLCY